MITLKKYHVICGPTLCNTYHLEFWGRYIDSIDPEEKHQQCIFPEKHFGAQGVRDWINAELNLVQETPFVIVTRYDAALNHLCNLAAEGVIAKEDFGVTLIRQNGVQSVHSINSDGYLDNDWPFGTSI